MLHYIQTAHLKSGKRKHCYRIQQQKPPHIVVAPRSSLLQCGFHRNTGLLRERQHVRRLTLYVATTPFENASNLIISASVQPILDSSSITVQPTFEPVLNVPAFTVFLFIMSIFVFLQWRIRAIDNAALERNMALLRLRNLKALELSDPTLSIGTNKNSVQAALEEYKHAYDRMEELRTILPGVRIVSPPSSNINSKQQRDHEIAAQQFLGIAPLNDDGDLKNATDNTAASSNDERLHEQRESSTPFPISPTMMRNTLLVFVAISQIALFLFLIGTDPMMQSSVTSNFRETTGSPTIYIGK
jgi:hypothetical protein